LSLSTPLVEQSGRRGFMFRTTRHTDKICFFAEIITVKIANLAPLADCRLCLKRAAYLI
jgi:hypothetical protein